MFHDTGRSPYYTAFLETDTLSVTDSVVTEAIRKSMNNIVPFGQSDCITFIKRSFVSSFDTVIVLGSSHIRELIVICLYLQRQSFRLPANNETCQNREPWQTRGRRDVTRWRGPRGCFSLAASFSRSTAPSDKVSKAGWNYQHMLWLILWVVKLCRHL